MEEIWSLYQDRTSRYKFSAVCRRNFGVVFEAAFYVFVGAKWKKLNFEKNAFIILGLIAKLFLANCQNFFGGVVKTALYVSIGPFWWERFSRKKFGLFIILGHRANFFRLLSTYFLRGFQVCILCFHRNISKKKNFRKSLWAF